MIRQSCRWLTGALAGLLLPVAAYAWHDEIPQHPPAPGCPAPSYSPVHYWLPSLHRVNACLHGPYAPTYAPDRFPGIPPTYLITRFPCPGVDPAALYGGLSLPCPPPPPRETRTPSEAPSVRGDVGAPARP
jgi:hypothetical protein